MSDSTEISNEAKEASSRQPYAAFKDEIHEQIVSPYIRAAARALGEDATVKGIHERFCEETGSTVSDTTFRKWMELAGVRLATAVVIDDDDAPTQEPE